MGTGGEHATEDQSRLALYLIGALDEAERVSFEEHLAGCWRCLNEATEIGASTSGLAGLADVDWELPTDADPLRTADPVTDVDPVATADSSAAASPLVTEGPAGDAVPPDSPQSLAGGPGRGPTGSVRPTDARPGGDRSAGARPDRGPATGRVGSRRRRWRIWGGAAAAVLALVLAGGVVAVNGLGGTDEPVLTASGEAPGYGASLSVSITADDDGRSTIRITVTGLRPGIHYRLFAVTRDGATHTVRDWMASSGPQEVTGETSLPIDELAFITVGTSDGTGIVTAPITRGAGSPR